MKKLTILTVVLGTLFLAGCNGEAVKTKDYYMKHEKARTTKLTWCDQSADRNETTNCKNAFSAEQEVEFDTLYGKGFDNPKS